MSPRSLFVRSVIDEVKKLLPWKPGSCWAPGSLTPRTRRGLRPWRTTMRSGTIPIHNIIKLFALFKSSLLLKNYLQRTQTLQVN
jgi:hypothetical protein